MDLKQRENIREFPLSTFAVKNQSTVFVITAIIIIAGIFSYRSMPKATFP